MATQCPGFRGLQSKHRRGRGDSHPVTASDDRRPGGLSRTVQQCAARAGGGPRSREGCVECGCHMCGATSLCTL